FSENLCPKDDHRQPLGVLKEAARNHILKSIPPPNLGAMTRQLMRAQQIFHDQGITHIRDVHFTEGQWLAAKHLDESGLLKLAVEVFVFDERLNADQTTVLALKFKSEQSPDGYLRVKGIKVFLDGSLGSETA